MEQKMVSNEELESPLNAIQQLMAITSEECGELTQVCMKVMRKYTTLNEIQNDKYRDLLIEEAGDVLCMIELLVEHGLLTNEELGARVTVKRNKLKTWSNLIK
jgi:NTP pyrophosphatase (non-canonical NTP hydrolase)